MEKQEELANVFYSVLNKLDNNDNHFKEFVKQQDLKNNLDNNDNNLNSFIKQQDLKNKIIINKLDKLIQAIA